MDKPDIQDTDLDASINAPLLTATISVSLSKVFLGPFINFAARIINRIIETIRINNKTSRPWLTSDS
jgi:hypothetical protein